MEISLCCDALEKNASKIVLVLLNKSMIWNSYFPNQESFKGRILLLKFFLHYDTISKYTSFFFFFLWMSIAGIIFYISIVDLVPWDIWGISKIPCVMSIIWGVCGLAMPENLKHLLTSGLVLETILLLHWYFCYNKKTLYIAI